MSETKPQRQPSEQFRADVLSEDFIIEKAPFLGRHRKLLKGIMHFFVIDKVNWLHSRNYLKPDGGEVCGGMVKDLDINLVVDGEEVLDNLPEGPFITVSNHPFGALDGIMLIYLIASRRPGFKVMVNMVLNLITGVSPNFIAVDALASDDPKKKAVSMRGIKEAIMQVKSGQPLGFFPAGAVSKINGHLRIVDREWQPSVIRVIEKCNVPVIPIFFHGCNSTFFNILGKISWKLRTLRLPAEVFNKKGKTMRVSVGQPISVEEQKKHQGSVEEFGRWLKAQTYALRDR